MTVHTLSQIPAKRCYTASGILVHDKKVLLAKHKMLGIWLPPGGHIEPDELPHTAAEREFWEETGLKVRTVSHGKMLTDNETEFLPVPLVANLHWISESNYRKRIKGKRVQVFRGGKTCEQHVVYVYLVKAINGFAFKRNVEEVEAIGWFGEKELENLETREGIKKELVKAFGVTS